MTIKELHKLVFEFLEEKRKDFPDLRYLLLKNSDTQVYIYFWKRYSWFHTPITIDLEKNVKIEIDVNPLMGTQEDLEGDWLEGKSHIFRELTKLLDQSVFKKEDYRYNKYTWTTDLQGLSQFITNDKVLIDRCLEAAAKTNPDLVWDHILGVEGNSTDSFDGLPFETYVENLRQEHLSLAEVGNPVKLTFAKLENIGHFSEISIDLRRQVTCIVGENGSGKSTILRAIALGLLGYSTSSTDEEKVFDNPELAKWLKIGKTSIKKTAGDISTQYEYTQNNGKITIGYKIQTNNLKKVLLQDIKFKGVVAETEQSTMDTNATEDWQVAKNGYFIDLILGFPQRGNPKKYPYPNQETPNINDVRPLIVEYDDERLRSFTKWLNKNFDRNPAAQETIKDIFRVISRIATQTNEQAIELIGVVSDTDVIVTTPENPEGITLNLLSQGYNNVFGWVGLLMCRLYETLQIHNNKNNNLFFDNRNKIQQGRYLAQNIRDLHAIVLIDEIDTYLHPEWQRTILNVLVNEFPNTQFVVTTHSADVLSNIDTSKDKDYFVYRLERSEDGMTCVELDPKADYNPFGAEINDIYTTIFDKDKRASARVVEKINQLQACIKAKQFEQADVIVTELKSIINPSDAELMRLTGILDTRKMLAK